jgi:hypothetical protein
MSVGPLSVIPCGIREAEHFVLAHHRHHGAPTGGLFACAVARRGSSDVLGIALVGRPVARLADDGWTVEVTRLCVRPIVAHNAASLLLGACWRAARALGWRKLITYTLEEEGGASLRAAGFTLACTTRGGSWDRAPRPRVDKHPTQPKLRWERIEDAA